MNNILDRFRIPTILGLAIILLGTGTGVYLVLQNQTVTSQAAVDNSPQQIVVSNITDTSAAITWQTAGKIGSFISYGTTTPNQTIVDDRDTGAPSPRNLHIATIRDLSPQTSYSFKVVAGKFNSPITQFQTAPSSSTQNSFKPTIGSVLDGDKPLDSGLVFLTIPGTVTQATAIKSLGNFIIPLSLARKEGLASILDTNISVANLTVIGEDGRKALATFNLNDENPLVLKLGQNLDLTKIPQPLGVATSKFDLNGDGQVSTADYALVNKALGKKPVDKKADLNGDGKVDKKDLDLILAEIKKNAKP